MKEKEKKKTLAPFCKQVFRNFVDVPLHRFYILDQGLANYGLSAIPCPLFVFIWSTNIYALRRLYVIYNGRCYLD